MINIEGLALPTWPCSATAGSSASAWVRTKRTACSHRSIPASPPRTRPSRSSALSLRSRWRTLPSDIKRSSERLIELVAASVAGIGSNNAWLGGGQAVIVLTPDHIGELAATGHDRLSTAGAIVERATTRDGRPAFESVDDILLVAAGDPGSTAMSSRPGVQGRTAPGCHLSDRHRPGLRNSRELMRRQPALAV